jgi:hypothetical protein
MALHEDAMKSIAALTPLVVPVMAWAARPALGVARQASVALCRETVTPHGWWRGAPPKRDPNSAADRASQHFPRQGG